MVYKTRLGFARYYARCWRRYYQGWLYERLRHDEKNKVQRLKRVSGEWCYTRHFMRLHQRKHRKYIP